MSTNYVEQSIALMGRVEAQELLPHAIRLLADGEPVPPERLATAAGWPVEDVEAALRAQASVERVDPPAAVMTAVRPRGQLADVRSATCNHGHFFSSIAATAAWIDAHPDGHIYLVEEAFRLDRQVIEQLGWEAR
jgi:Alkylmercury lyase/Helix-turn-helix domain of alkylmercury lyase